MSTGTFILALVVALILVVVLLGVAFAVRKWRSEKLREKFGPEYDYTLQKTGDQHAAEEDLVERQNRVNQMDIHSLEEDRRNLYQTEWTKIQADFVDSPANSVKEANRLVGEVMFARGFPVADFEQRAADLSVLYPNFVPTYRKAYSIALNNQKNASSTEELRQAMVYYHSLFEELLGTEQNREVETVQGDNHNGR